MVKHNSPSGEMLVSFIPRANVVGEAEEIVGLGSNLFLAPPEMELVASIPLEETPDAQQQQQVAQRRQQLSIEHQQQTVYKVHKKEKLKYVKAIFSRRGEV